MRVGLFGGQFALLSRQREAKGRAHAWLALDRDLPTVGFDELFDDGEPEAHAAFLLRVCLRLIEYFTDALFRDPGARVLDPALDLAARPVGPHILGPDSDLTVRGVVDGVGDQVLEDLCE